MVTKLWETYSDQVFYYLNKRINDDEVARDLLQDTFQKVWVHKERLDQVENPKAWLFNIARNTLIDYTRKRKEEPTDDFTVLAANDETAVSKSVAEGIAECLYGFIDEYEGVDREVLLKVFTKSLSQKEASQYLDIPYSTLKSRIQKAREEILNKFQAHCCKLNYNRHGEIIGCSPVGVKTTAEC